MSKGDFLVELGAEIVRSITTALEEQSRTVELAEEPAATGEKEAAA